MKEFQIKFNSKEKTIENEIENISSNRLPIILLLDGMNDIGNVGMIFRIADALRIKKIILYKTSNEFNIKLLQKKSRTTINYVDYEYINDINLIAELRNEYEPVVLDKTNKSINFKDYTPIKPICLIVGAERTGVSSELLNKSAVSIHLPMNGINTSINVATAVSVVLYDFYNKISG